jgi:hypothetical protein
VENLGMLQRLLTSFGVLRPAACKLLYVPPAIGDDRPQQLFNHQIDCHRPRLLTQWPPDVVDYQAQNPATPLVARFLQISCFQKFSSSIQ